MATLDKIFEVVFARFRRELGDSNIEVAWRRASLRVSGYVGWPTTAALVVLMAVLYSLASFGTPPEHKRWAQLVAGAVGVLVTICLDKRFRKFLVAPPTLPEVESRSAALLVFWFRVICLGVFAITCLVGYLLHESGARIVQGF